MPDLTAGGDKAGAPALTQPPRGGAEFYQAYGVDEDTIRSAYHYEQDPEFYYTQTGGEWNVYSCLMWEDGFTATQAQEKKLDKLAELMELEPGQHILDVGCGWGGPLVYLCQKYGVTGHGIAVSPNQIAASRSRAARYGIGATFELVHWQNLPEVETYDAIFSDEVIVHFLDLGGFFAKCRKLLKPRGLNVHKELHLSHSSYSVLGPLSRHIIKVFAYTGNYVPLHRELTLLDDNGFEITHVFEVPMRNYHRTVDMWDRNIFDHRERLKSVVGQEFYNNYRAYLKAVRFVHTRTNLMQLHVVASRKMG